MHFQERFLRSGPWYRRRDRFRPPGGMRAELKGLHDFVTEADRAAEEEIVAYVRTEFPGHAILAEEGSPRDASQGTRWVIDPLDGTTNFIHGVATFAVSIAVEDATGVLAGAVYDPVHEEMFHARRRGGARLNGVPIACSRPGSL